MPQPARADQRSYRVTEETRVPWLSLVLGYGPMLPIVAGAAAVWLVPGDLADVALRLTLIWSGTILAFLSGVRRGLAFRAPHPETLPQLATMLWLFLLALAVFLTMPHAIATGLLVIGYASLGLFDWLAARREEAPPYFAKLRPPQMAVAVVALAAVLLHQLAAR